jgi:branched-chain amino acid transport system permease protein
MIGQLLNGLIVGTGYALVAMGWTLVFGVLRKLNMAHGAMFATAALVAFVAWKGLGGREDPSASTLLLSGLVAVVVGAVAGWVVYVVAFLPVRGDDPLPPIVTTLSVSAIATSLGAIVFGSSPQALSDNDIGGTVHILDVPIATVQLVIVGVALVICGLVIAMVHHTPWGRSVRAISESAMVARRAGVKVERVIAQVFLFSGAIAGLGAYLWTIRVGSVTPYMGDQFLITGLVVMVIGGLGRMGGALAAGLLVGALEGLCVAWFSGASAELISWVAIAALLLLRPEGLFAKARTV